MCTKFTLKPCSQDPLGVSLIERTSSLSPKLDDPKVIMTWRLITLLNVSYKIIAKVLSLRIRHLLPLLVRS